jgi:hypothetical protein
VSPDVELYCGELKELRRLVKAESRKSIAKKLIRTQAERLASLWFSDIGPHLESASIAPKPILDRYAADAARLLKLSAPNNQRTSYLETLDSFIKPMRDELIIPIKSGAGSRASQSIFSAFVATLNDPDESSYFSEAIECAKLGYLRAAAVMGWCAAIDRIHRKIEHLGFTIFNVTSAQMVSQQKGRYRRFSQTQSVTSISELREVFDTTVLWILEGMALIDSNQHTRLRSCFEMRCHCAHPGDAPITEYNLLSFFSDLQQIVLDNPQFHVPPTQLVGVG